MTNIDRPTAGEIEAYYLGGGGLSPEVYTATELYVKEHYLDGGTREKFLEQRARVEKAIAEEFEKG